MTEKQNPEWKTIQMDSPNNHALPTIEVGYKCLACNGTFTASG